MGLDLCRNCEEGSLHCLMVLSWIHFYFKMMLLFLFFCQVPRTYISSLWWIFHQKFFQGEKTKLSILTIPDSWNAFPPFIYWASLMGQTLYNLFTIPCVHWEVMNWAQQWNRKGCKWTRRKLVTWVCRIRKEGDAVHPQEVAWSAIWRLKWCDAFGKL